MISDEGIEKLFQDVAEIQSTLLLLKSQLDTLSERVDQFEDEFDLSGMQDQISSIGEGVKSLKAAQDKAVKENSQIATGIIRRVCRTSVNFEVLNFSLIIRNQSTNQTLINQLLIDASKAKALIAESKNPLTAYDDFKEKWDKIITNEGFSVMNF